MFTINIIGAGRLGKTIGKLIATQRAGIIQGICNQSLESSCCAVEFIGEGKAYDQISQLPPADITLITTPDDDIKVAAIHLSNSEMLKEGSFVIHCSGSLTSAELEPVKAKPCYTASVHPMHSFANPAISVNTFANTYCAIEGEDSAVATATILFKKIGALTYAVNSDKKALYHAAGVIASNYLVTLCNQAKTCMESAGVEEKMAMKIITSLMQGTLTNLSTTLSPKNSLTGPIKRGDEKTIAKHKEAFISNQELNSFYSEMGLLTLELVEHEKDKDVSLRSLLQVEV